jgi:hypothetical protein
MAGEEEGYEEAGYRAYLLRLWRAGSKDTLDWRSSLESTGTGELRMFTNLSDLFEFLEAQIEENQEEDNY